MRLKTIVALGAGLLLALGSTVAGARTGGGGGGGGGAGAHFSGGGGGGGGGGHFGGGGHMGGGSPHFSGRSEGGNFSARSFRSGPSAGSRSFNSPRIARGDRSFRDGRRFANDHGRWRGDRHHRHHRGYPVIVGGVYYDDYYDDDYGYYGGDNCAWLYRKAVRTGSPYWWRRYRNCID